MRKPGLVVLLTCALSAAAQTQWLPQNWTSEDSQWFYTTPQGSKLILYTWALALERADSDQLWYKSLDRFYYLPNPVSSWNPDGLPVGIVKDGEHLGLTCAACHTGAVQYGGVTYQIDGAPSDADVFAFLADLAAAVRQTTNSEAKFKGFAQRVLGPDHSRTDRRKLHSQLSKYNIYIQQLLRDSTPRVRWGRARTDAFGMIFNRVTSIDLKIPSNSAKPNAPVSYPFLWDASWLDKVQWNGIAANTNVVDRLARNVGEVLGVFAQIDIRKPTFFHFWYESTAKRLNLIALEDRLAKLRSPQWPAAFGALDPAKIANGKALYTSAKCIQCHALVTPGQPQVVTLTALSTVQTDPAMTTMVASRRSATGVLEGVRKFLIFGPRMGASDLSATITGNAVIGAMVSPFESEGQATPSFAEAAVEGTNDDRDDDDRERLRRQILEGPRRRGHDAMAETPSATPAGQPPPPSQSRADLETQLRAFGARLHDAQQTNGLVYKARPLDGIWATAPYLHNGSVPTLWALLSSERPATFWVGSRQFDPVRVGFVTDESPGAFLFDTSIPGNLNGGHTWGTELRDEQKWALIEYLKSL